LVMSINPEFGNPDFLSFLVFFAIETIDIHYFTGK
jgi:hypothetical protein